MASLPLAQVAAAIEAQQGRPIVDIQVLGTAKRAYSSIWEVAVRSDGGTSHYVVKEAGDRARHQVELSRRADLLFATDPSVASVGLVHVESVDLVVGPAFSGPSLVASTTSRPLGNPLRRYRDVRDRLCRAGRWLARYHAAARIPSGGAPLLDYIDNRRAVLSELPHEIRDRLLEIACEPFESDFTIIHGDFTAGNVLVDDDRLCVIDFGVAEWTAMSGWWDVVALLISLRRSLLFSARSPAAWIPSSLRLLERAFLGAYGHAPLHNRDFLRCLAVRHFTYWAQDPSRSLDVRTPWHFNHLVAILNQLRED